jgi:hypothetical protein
LLLLQVVVDAMQPQPHSSKLKMTANIYRHEQNVSDAVHTFIMPVTPEFSWNETDGVVRMEVKLTSATSFTDNDVVASDVFVKVNCPPYLLQLDLFGYVDPEKTEVTVNKPCIKFKFFKQTKVPLSRLHLSLTTPRKDAPHACVS